MYVYLNLYFRRFRNERYWIKDFDTCLILIKFGTIGKVRNKVKKGYNTERNNRRSESGKYGRIIVYLLHTIVPLSQLYRV